MANKPTIVVPPRIGSMAGIDEFLTAGAEAANAAAAVDTIYGKTPAPPPVIPEMQRAPQGSGEIDLNAAIERAAAIVRTATGQAATVAPPPSQAATAAGSVVPTTPSVTALAGGVKLDDLKGQGEANAWVNAMDGRIRLRQARSNMKLGTATKLSAGFFGPDGVGKKMTAQVYAARMHELGVIKDPKVLSIDLRKELDEGTLAQTVEDAKAAGAGVIYFDNLQALNPTKNKAETKLIADLAGLDKEPIVLVGGSAAARGLVDTSWRLKQAFASQVNFKALSPNDMRDILIGEAAKRGYELDEEAKKAVFGRLRSAGRTGASTALALLDKAEERLAARLFPTDKPRETPPTDKELRTLTAFDLQGESPFDAEGKLKSLERFMKERVGQDGAKKWAEGLVKYVQDSLRRQSEGKKVEQMLLNGTVEGEPGTGKTTLIEFVNEIFTQLGIRNGKIVYKTAAELKGRARGEAEAIVKQMFDEGEGGIIVVDEAHQLTDDEFGQTALKAALPLALNYSANTSIFFLGYDLKRIYDVDDGWERRIPKDNRVVCESFTREQLRELVKQYCKSAEYKLADGAEDAALFQLDKQAAGKGFGNAGAVNNVCQAAIKLSAVRGAGDDTLMPTDFGGVQRTMEEVLGSLETDYVGLSAARPQLERFAKQLATNRKDKVALRTGISPYTQIVADEPALRESLASAMAAIYAELGVIGKAKPKFVDALNLVAGYTGQTRGKVHDIVNEALGGMMVLGNLRAFVDSLDDFGKQALGGLKDELKTNRDKLTFLLSGEASEIADFLALDSELADLITDRVELPKLDAAGATELLRRSLEKEGCKLDDDAAGKLASVIDKAIEAPGWNSMGTVQALVRRIKTEHSVVRLQAEFADRDSRLIAPQALTQAIENYVMEQNARFPSPRREVDDGVPVAGVGLLPKDPSGQSAPN